MAALDIAVWDAPGRRNKVSHAKLLLGSSQPSVPIYLSGLRRGTVVGRGELLSDLMAGGLGAVKIFAGKENAETLAEVDALRSRVPGS
jgi:L-alanine-DL-glutamate epimerase-like enolase superfamily enzyme